jgi:alpha-beta hydrolase superfamily lysophospholipase
MEIQRGLIMSEPAEQTGHFESSDGLSVFYRHYPAESERARLVIAHGLGEHSGRYGNVVNELLPKGVSVFALDHRGHGQSDGKRGHILSFDNYLSDLHAMVAIARSDLATDRRCFLLGHSMGGLIALNYALRFPETIDGMVVSSPACGIAIEVPGAKKMMAKIMSAIWPGLIMGNELDASKISHDEDTITAYQQDPRVHDRVSARWFTEFLAAMETANQKVSQLSVPILMQIAGDDHLVNPQASQRFFEKLTIDDKTLYVYDGLYHEIYNEMEADKQKVLSDLAEWIDRRI